MSERKRADVVRTFRLCSKKLTRPLQLALPRVAEGGCPHSTLRPQAPNACTLRREPGNWYFNSEEPRLCGQGEELLD